VSLKEIDYGWDVIENRIAKLSIDADELLNETRRD